MCTSRIALSVPTKNTVSAIMLGRQVRTAAYMYVVSLCLCYIFTTIDASQHRGVILLGVADKRMSRRNLKKGKKGKKHVKEYPSDDMYYDDIISPNTTTAPNTSIAPTPSTKSLKKKKKGKKGEKSKKKKKSTKGDESLSPSPSPNNATAPMGIATNTPIATTAPIVTNSPISTTVTTAPAIAAAPLSNPGNDTLVTSSPTIQSMSKKKKSKKMSAKGKGKGGTSDEPFQSAGSSQLTKSSKQSVSSAPLASYAAPTIARSKPIPTNAPKINKTLAASKAPTLNNIKTLNTGYTSANKATKVPFPSPSLSPSQSPSHSPSPSPSPSPLPLGENESLSSSPEPSASLQNVDVTPFQLTYNIVTTEQLSTEQINEAVDITFTFVNDYLMDTIDVNDQISYDSLIGSRIAHSIDYTTVQYMATVRFLIPGGDETASYLPGTTDIDAAIEMAFSPNSVMTLIDMLRNLQATNPYCQTTNIVYTSISVQTPSTTLELQPPPMGNGDDFATRVGISGAVLVICLFTGMIALYRWGYFKKLRRKKDKTNYNKAPRLESKSRSTATKTNHNADDGDEVNDEGDEDEAVSISDCTSSIHSCPLTSSCDDNAVDNNELYRNRILEEDVEIEFLYPTSDQNMNCDLSVHDHDPLFPTSPLISKESNSAKRRAV